MNNLKRIDLLYHRLLAINERTLVPKYMKDFMHLNSLDQKILSVVFGRDNITISEITKMLSKKKSTMTSAINRLEKENLISREISKLDKRVYLIKLTNKGLKLQNGHLKYEKELFNNILDSLDDDLERERFLDMFEKIINRFDK